MLKRLILIFALGVFTVANANAATVRLFTQSGSSGPYYAVPGEMLELLLVVDLGDEQSFGGGFDFDWDASVLNVEGPSSITIIAPVSDPAFERVGDVTAGNILGLGFANFLTPYTGKFFAASIEFDVIGAPGDFAFIEISPNDMPVGPLRDLNGMPIDVEYFDFEVRVIPLPSAIVLMLGGLAGIVVGFRRPAGHKCGAAQRQLVL